MRIDQMFDNHEHVRSAEDNNVRFQAVPKVKMFVRSIKKRKNYQTDFQRAKCKLRYKQF